MYYIIYETTCIVNKKKYIGKHTTDKLDDDYLGSGLLLSNAIKKYGKENFIKEILFVFDNEVEMNKKEIEIVNESIINDDNYYNIALGGQGGNIVLSPSHPLYEEVCKKISNAALLRSKQISDTVKQLHKEKRCGMHGKKQTENQKIAVSNALKGKPKTQEHKENHYASLMKTLNDPTYIHPNKNRAKPKTQCVYCSRLIDNSNYKRYHGEKCKLKNDI
jgi:hypothetical protein